MRIEPDHPSDELDSDAIPDMDLFVLRIRLGNDGMENVPDVMEALRAVIGNLSHGTVEPFFGQGSMILDANGNSVGSWAFHLHAGPPDGGPDEEDES